MPHFLSGSLNPIFVLWGDEACADTQKGKNIVVWVYGASSIVMPLGSKRSSANRTTMNGKASQDASKSTSSEPRSRCASCNCREVLPLFIVVADLFLVARHSKGQANGVARPVVDDNNGVAGESQSKAAALGTVVYQRLPDLPSDGPISWETYLLVFLLTALFLQNFNIYHTVRI